MFNSLWYDSLQKPLFNPPGWIFTPTWIFLYTTMLISCILFIVKDSGWNKKRGYIYFCVQLLLNFAWTPAFFIANSILLALIIILLLDLFVIMTIIQFYKVSKLAALLLIPYLLWILFATYLNIAFFILN